MPFFCEGQKHDVRTNNGMVIGEGRKRDEQTPNKHFFKIVTYVRKVVFYGRIYADAAYHTSS